MFKMILVDCTKLELYIFILISLLAFSAGLPNNLDDLHNQLNDNQQVSISFLSITQNCLELFKTD